MGSKMDPVAENSQNASTSPTYRRPSGQMLFLSDGVAVSFGDRPVNPDPHDPPPKNFLDSAAYCIAALMRQSDSSAFEVQVQGVVKSLSATVTIREPALRKLPVLWDMFVVRSLSLPRAYVCSRRNSTNEIMSLQCFILPC